MSDAFPLIESPSRSDGPGATPTVGVVAPYDMALDGELRRFSRDADGREQLDMLFTRTRFEELAVSDAQALALGDAGVLAEAVRSLIAVDVEQFLYACTSGSFAHGLAGERRLAAELADIGGAPLLTTSGALLEAVRAAGARRIATATPYDAEITARFAAYFAEAGFEQVSSGHLNLAGRIWTVPYDRTADLVREADSPAADMVVVSCTNLPTYGLLDALSEELGKPVVSANQASVWAVLHRAGLPYCGPGAALRDPAEPSRQGVPA
ncbi:MAG: Asp/Glu/hydantoin racemase [Nesterenkonia sp.]|nr:Asp/Glu/hydantoin racemase [Nesterenkonia sp.]